MSVRLSAKTKLRRQAKKSSPTKKASLSREIQPTSRRPKSSAKAKKPDCPGDPLLETRNSSFPPSVRPGIPRLGKTPKGWRRVKFSDVLEIVSRPVKLRDDKEYQLVTAKRSRGGIVPRERLLGREIRVKQQFRIEAGDFIVSRRQIVHGACGFVPVELAGATVSGEYDVFRLKPGVTPQFFAYFTHTEYFQKSCYFASVGVALEKMVFDLELWLRLNLDVPSHAEQDRIVKALSVVDKATQEVEYLNRATLTTAKAAMNRLFCRGVRNSPRKPISGWKLGQPNGLESCPRDWELVRLTEVAKLESGHTPSRGIPTYWGGTIPWLSLHDSQQFSLRTINVTSQCVTERGIQNSSARILPAGTVAFCRTASVGYCVLLGRPMATSQDFANFVCGPRLHNRYLLHLFRWLQGVWKTLASGSTHQTIYMPIFESLHILLPSIKEQEEIASLADVFADAIEAHEREIVQIRTIRDALIIRLITKH